MNRNLLAQSSNHVRFRAAANRHQRVRSRLAVRGAVVSQIFAMLV
jgi:hypothetical protein